jgi:uncharacterized membrane protein
MKKQEFLKLLKAEAYDGNIDAAMINYYDELISDRIEAGEDEEKVVASYDIKKIVRSMEYETAKKELVEQTKEKKGPKGWVVLALLCSAPVTLPIGIAFAGVLFALCATVIVLLVAAIAGIVFVIGSVVELAIMGEAFRYLLLSFGGGMVALGIVGILGYYGLKWLRALYTWVAVKFFRMRKKGEVKA